MRKIIIFFLAALMVFTSFSIASADTALISKNSGSHTFKKKWESPLYKVTGKYSGKHSLFFGYNTFLINEDYATADSNGVYHYARIKNDRGYHKGPRRYANQGPSDVDVRHKGSKICYYCMEGNPPK